MKRKKKVQKDDLGTFCSFNNDIWHSIPNIWSSGSISLSKIIEQQLVRDGIACFAVKSYQHSIGSSYGEQQKRKEYHYQPHLKQNIIQYIIHEKGASHLNSLSFANSRSNQ